MLQMSYLFNVILIIILLFKWRNDIAGIISMDNLRLTNKPQKKYSNNILWSNMNQSDLRVSKDNQKHTHLGFHECEYKRMIRLVVLQSRTLSAITKFYLLLNLQIK